jgi:hypothetical protein
MVGSQVIQSTDLDDHRIFGSGPANNEQGELLPYLKDGLLNVFVHHILVHGQSTGGGNAYSIPNAYLSLDDGALDGVCCPATLTHEVGHCLGLYHTFEWRWNDGQVKENVDRTGLCANCSTEGDLLCDTPADPHELATIGADTTYMLVWDHLTNCQFDTVVNDICNDQFDPDEANMMSYFPDTCHTLFSNDQGLRALSFLNGDLADLKAPESVTLAASTTYTNGELFHTAKQTITYSAINLLYTADVIVRSASGNVIIVMPGTTFSPGTGYAVLSAQNACN